MVVMKQLGEVSDTSEGRTVFIRNLSFDVDNDTLFAFFAKFGSIEFAKVVRDPTTQHSRGTAFVKFSHAEDAARVIADSSSSGSAPLFTLDNRTMSLTMAVSRSEVQQLRQSNQATLSNKLTGVALKSGGEPMAQHLHQTGRNLHLARIGIIRPGTAAAEGLTAEDLARREALLRAKKIKLKNPNVFISDVRLCIRNLPLSVTDKQLRQVCQKIIGNAKHCRIIECRVMRNLQPGKQQFRSLGYGFVTFVQHKHALKVLNELNNNPDVFPNQRRPIVDFSLENMLALEKKRKRAERCAMLQAKRKQTGTTETIRHVGSGVSNKRSATDAAVGVDYSGKRIKQMNRAASQSRVLPKRLGAKNRHRNRGSGKSKATKPKARASRSQIRAKKLNKT
ncbi:RNA-binding protein 28 [Fasciola gigantica]|uniref:RNA-binding protein 28 n=1 Tax=Fasciola gigantica TaxID=46835 RepID=A0A504Y5S1_FASGI|nr:RNA-binding protein 28 [Fasciola gigantica]